MYFCHVWVEETKAPYFKEQMETLRAYEVGGDYMPSYI